MEVFILQPLANSGSEILDEDGNSAFLLDATVSESHDITADVTMHEVEEGSAITDHVRVRPLELQITGIVTNTPTTPDANLAEMNFLTNETRVQRTYGVMKRLLEARAPVTIVTGLRTYESMVLKSINVSRSSPGTQSISPQMSFVQIRRASLAYTAVPPNILAPKTKASGQSQQDLEQQAAKDASAPEKDKVNSNKTLLATTIESLAKFTTGL